MNIADLEINELEQELEEVDLSVLLEITNQLGQIVGEMGKIL